MVRTRLDEVIGDLELLHEISGCEVGGAMGIYVKGHISNLLFRMAVQAEHDEFDSHRIDVTREWWQDVPLSLYDPNEEPCGDWEPMIYDPCEADAPGAYAVTVAYF